MCTDGTVAMFVSPLSDRLAAGGETKDGSFDHEIILQNE